MKCETVKIKGQDGKPVVINKAEFDSEKHTLYVVKATKKEATKKEATKKD